MQAVCNARGAGGRDGTKLSVMARDRAGFSEDGGGLQFCWRTMENGGAEIGEAREAEGWAGGTFELEK